MGMPTCRPCVPRRCAASPLPGRAARPDRRADGRRRAAQSSRIFPPLCAPIWRRHRGEQGGKQVQAAHPDHVFLLPMDDVAAEFVDIDRPADLRRLSRPANKTSRRSASTRRPASRSRR
jgi:hypothetical protein